MSEKLSTRLKKWYYHLKQRVKPSLLDLDYTGTSDSEKPFATPEIMEDYIRRGADPNEKRSLKGNKYTRPIFEATTAGHVRAFRCLISHGAYIRTRRDGKDSEYEVDWLLAHCPHADIRKNLLHFKEEQRELSAQKRRAAEEKAAQERRAAEAKKRKEALIHLDYKTATAEDVRRALQNGADINAINLAKTLPADKGKEYTPIFATIRAGNWEVFKTLVDNGANLTAYWDGYWPNIHECHWSKNTAGGIEEIYSWIMAHRDFLDAIQDERRAMNKDPEKAPMVPMDPSWEDTQRYVGRNGIISLSKFEEKQGRVATLRHRKEVEPGRKEVNTLLRTIRKATPSSKERRAARVAVAKSYREQHPKKGKGSK